MKLAIVVLLAVLSLASATTYFKETFDADWESRWVESSWKKADGTAGKFKRSHGEFYGDAEADMGIQTSQDARFYALSAKFDEFTNKDKDFVIQFSVKHEQKIDCGGGYVKIFPAGLDQANMAGDSKYNIMFGPDICGTNKRTHVIFGYNDENLLVNREVRAESDERTHVYTLIVRPDNTYEVRIDGEKAQDGKLDEDWDFLEPKMINDPSQSKPKDWVDESMMDDPEAEKPEGYDDIPAQIVDPEAEMPEDWDEEDDGEWEAPMLDNPEYKGPWKASKVSNPDYQGPWVHPQIDNPEYEADDELYMYESFGVIGFDLWQVKSGTIFDNVIITDSIDEAVAFMDETWNNDAEKKMYDEQQEAQRSEAAAAAAAAAEDDDDDDDEDYDDDDDEDEAPTHEEL